MPWMSAQTMCCKGFPHSKNLNRPIPGESAALLHAIEPRSTSNSDLVLYWSYTIRGRDVITYIHTHHALRPTTCPIYKSWCSHNQRTPSVQLKWRPSPRRVSCSRVLFFENHSVLSNLPWWRNRSPSVISLGRLFQAPVDLFPPIFGMCTSILQTLGLHL